MAGMIATNSALMHQISNTCEDQAKIVSQCHEICENLLEDLRQNGWRAPVADKFYNVMDTKLMIELGNLSNALNTTAEFVAQINDIIVNADDEGSSLLQVSA